MHARAQRGTCISLHSIGNETLNRPSAHVQPLFLHAHALVGTKRYHSSKHNHTRRTTATQPLHHHSHTATTTPSGATHAAGPAGRGPAAPAGREWRVAGVAAPFRRALLNAVLPGVPVRRIGRECRRKAKTVLLPAVPGPAWQPVAIASPCGSFAATLARYLGGLLRRQELGAGSEAQRGLASDMPRCNTRQDVGKCS